MNQQDVFSTIDNLFSIICVKHRKTLQSISIANYDNMLSVYYEKYYSGHIISTTLVSDRGVITDEVKSLLGELKQVYLLLEGKGISKEMIRTMLAGDDHVSMLTIGDDGEITLPEYSQQEGRYTSNISLTPLQLSLYILFLKHPEGIILKDIGNYTAEQEQLLRTAISIRRKHNMSVDVNEAKISKLVQSITNPASPTIHECISRIKHAFNSEIGSSAYHYYISGVRGGVYNIPLAREFVTLHAIW